MGKKNKKMKNQKSFKEKNLTEKIKIKKSDFEIKIEKLEKEIAKMKKDLLQNEDVLKKDLKKIENNLKQEEEIIDKKNKRLNQEKEDKNRILKEQYSNFIFKPKKDNELEVFSKSKKKKDKKVNKKNIYTENNSIKSIKFSIPKYKLPEVGELYEDKNKFYLVIEDYEELNKANEIAEHRYKNAKVVVKGGKL